jgi:hypothetical protein
MKILGLKAGQLLSGSPADSPYVLRLSDVPLKAYRRKTWDRN